jgi:DNA-binding IclR family transcriptional regulator
MQAHLFVVVALATMEHGRGLTRAEVMKKLGLSKTTSGRYLNKMVRSGHLRQHGSRSNPRYYLSDREINRPCPHLDRANNVLLQAAARLRRR